MVHWFPTREEWLGQNLWALMQLAISAESKRPKIENAADCERTTSVPSQAMLQYALRRANEVKSLRSIAVETGVHRESLRVFLNGTTTKLHGYNAARLSEYFAEDIKAVMMPTK